MASISRDDVAHVARLARLELTDDELDVFTSQLAAVLDHAADVEALDVGDVPPTMHPSPLRNGMGADVVRPSVDRDEVLGQAPAAEDGRFKVPAILGEGPGPPPRWPPTFAPGAAGHAMSSRSTSPVSTSARPNCTRSTSCWRTRLVPPPTRSTPAS